VTPNLEMMKETKGNSLAGVKVGHATHPDHLTGLTVFLCPEGSVGGADVRGPAPGTREIALLSPMKKVSRIDAILLSGGSAFGLSAADGVVRYLAEREIGYPTPLKNIPIVSAAIVYDLLLGGGLVFPNADMAYDACLSAGKMPIEQGNVGAGAGVIVGGWGGPAAMMKGGFGIASYKAGDLEVCAAAVVNSSGDVIDNDGQVLAGARGQDGAWLVEEDPWRQFFMPSSEVPPTQTTLVVVMTNARLDKIGANLLAMRAQDGIAISVQPAHTSVDGDVTFAVATGKVEAAVDLVGNMAVAAVSEAIRSGVRHAKTVGALPGLAAA
jgi:L-aminopeptidase/D-esterase-like protein